MRIPLEETPCQMENGFSCQNKTDPLSFLFFSNPLLALTWHINFNVFCSLEPFRDFLRVRDEKSVENEPPTNLLLFSKSFWHLLRPRANCGGKLWCYSTTEFCPRRPAEFTFINFVWPNYSGRDAIEHVLLIESHTSPRRIGWTRVIKMKTEPRLKR